MFEIIKPDGTKVFRKHPISRAGGTTSENHEASGFVRGEIVLYDGWQISGSTPMPRGIRVSAARDRIQLLFNELRCVLQSEARGSVLKGRENCHGDCNERGLRLRRRDVASRILQIERFRRHLEHGEERSKKPYRHPSSQPCTKTCEYCVRKDTSIHSTFKEITKRRHTSKGRKKGR